MYRSILIAPYAFKGTFSAADAGEMIADEWRSHAPKHSLRVLPLGDGGTGTLDALIAGVGGTLRHATTRSVLGTERIARWGILSDGRAVIVGAECIPLADVPDGSRNPAVLSTRGIGGLIVEAINAGCRDLLVGLGDTATHDCGVGVAYELGLRFFDEQGDELEPIGASLPRLHRIDATRADWRLGETRMTVLCDVLNTLCGEDGAALRFAPQKGADPETTLMLESGSRRFAEVVLEEFGRDVMTNPGSGAAGGLGAGLAGMFGARLVGGAEAVLDAVDFNRMLQRVDVLITAEGRVDRKTLFGKGVAEIVRRASKLGVRSIVLTGGVEGNRSEIETQLGASLLVGRRDLTTPRNQTEAEHDLRRTVREAVRLVG